MSTLSTLEPADPPLLEAAHLSRVAGGVRLVDDVTVQVRRREVLAVVGPSGSGKSSFLRLLNRLDEPTSGTVYLEGRDYRLIPPRELRRRVGMVTQTAFLFPGTIGDNLRVGPRHRGQELEILQGVGGAAAFRSEDDDADHAGTPAQGRDQGHRRRRRGQGGGDVGGQRHGDVVLAGPAEQR